MSGRLALQRMALVVDGRTATQRRVSAMWVVPTFQPIENRHLRFGLALEATPVEHFTLERGEERFGHRVVVCIPHRAHRGHDARFPTALAEGVAGVLGSRGRSDESPLSACGS